MSTPISGAGSTPSTTTGTTSPSTTPNLTGINSPTISFGGLVSGLNTQQIVQALMQQAEAPMLQLEQQQVQEQAKLQAWNDLSTKLQTLQTASDDLKLQGSVNARKLTFGGPAGTFASGSASSSAVNGSFTLEIDQLATATSVTSTAGIGAPITGADIVTGSTNTSTPITAGTFTVNGQTVTITSGETFSQVMTAIGTATSGAVTASIVSNTVQLTSASPITLGSGGDTSNFLSVTKLLGQPSGTTMTSSGPVGVANASDTLDNANLNGLTSTPNGSFIINGVTIKYDTTKDSLQDVLNRINASSAGVTASYDPNSDAVTIVSNNTGNVDVQLQDSSGNLLGTLNVTAAGAHHVGQSAKYEVNGGSAQYSLSNTINNLVPGVTATLQAVTALNSPITGTVTTDTSVGETALQGFVTAYNAVVDLIQTDTAYDTTTKQAGIFLGDPSIDNIQNQLDTALFIVNGSTLTPPYTDVSTIGLNTGPIGSSPGTTTDLKFDSSTFDQALQANPAAVTNLVNTVFTAFSGTMTGITQPFGVVDSAVQSETQQITDLQDQISFQQVLLQQQQDFLNQEFTNLDTQLAQIQSQNATATNALSLLASGASSTTPSSTSTSSTTGTTGTSTTG